MIGRDLKVGDRFEDGGRTFVVEKVIEEGIYESRIVYEDEVVEKPKKTTKKK